MRFFSALRGTIESIFSLGLGGPQLKNNAAVIESRNATDAGYVVHRGANAVSGNDFLTFQQMGPVGGTIAPVATAAALSAIDTATLTTDTSCWVQSFDAEFDLSTTSTATVQTGVVVATLSGTGRWLRRVVPSYKWQAQADWYFNDSVGNDEYDGTATAHGAGLIGPLKTWGEYIRRTGMVLTVPTIFHIPATNPPADIPNLNFTIQQAGSFSIIGTRSAALVSGTFTAVTALNRAANVPWSVTDGAIADWTPYVGKLGVITGGTRAGAVFWIAKRTAATVARISPLATYPSDGSPVTLVTPTAGDPYSIFDLPAITLNTLTCVGGELLYYNILENIDLRGNTTGTQLSIDGDHNCYVTLSSCIATNATPSGPTVTFQASKIAGVLSDVIGGFVNYEACLHTATVAAHGGIANFRLDSLAQGCALFSSRGGPVITDNCCAFDSPDYGVRASRGGAVECKNGFIYGSGNTTYGLAADNGTFVYLTKPTITGTLADALIGLVAKPWAQVPYTSLDTLAQVSLSGTTAPLVEQATLAAAQHVVSLVKGSAVTTTQMPAGSGDYVIYIADAATAPTGTAGQRPVGGGSMYSQAGAGKWCGSSGTITTFGPAEPHCPRCGMDYAVEHQNAAYAARPYFAACWHCLANALTRMGIDESEYMIPRKGA